ncbi:hypothetical protein CJA_3175 [Cellvibrio japonicus Ueda107]|uniref:Uncharacterized protein n=1 Tax=Cellvibrio japonicus (strain Ueda107) TaxID=498211 RepID=B3PDX2_CELJU|nr:hypothetical protein CJA_3175 [Cellvibrio japonicus Ueda107]
MARSAGCGSGTCAGTGAGTRTGVAAADGKQAQAGQQ